jgi:hypothetical protein
MEKQTIDSAVFEFDKADGIEGFEEMDGSTKSVPFLRVIQSLSPQLKRDKPEFIPGAEEGMYCDTIAKKIVEKPFRCIVLDFKHIYIEWKPNREGFVQYHSIESARRLALDPNAFGKWYNKETGDGKTIEKMNILQENYVYALIIEGRETEGPIIYSMSSTALSAAKAWNRMMTTHILPDGSKAKPYYLIWSLDTVKHPPKNGNEWYVPLITFDRVIDDRNLYLAVKQERQVLPDRRVDYAQIEGPDASIESEDF